MFKHSFILLIIFLMTFSCSDGGSTSDPDDNDNVSPVCNITSPLEGANFYKNYEIVISADASDSDGSIAGVNFSIDGIGIGTDYTEPYTFTLSPGSIVPGSHILSATATDNDGAVTTAVINFTVLNVDGGIITVTKPGSSDNWLVGTKHDIKWTDNITENVKIDLFKGSEFIKNIVASTQSDGVYNWIVTDTLETGVDYKVRITSTTDPIAYGDSFSLFQISGGIIPGEMIFVKGGTFNMGDYYSDYYSYDLPIHSVNLSDFYICATEVTQKEYKDVTGSNPSADFGRGDNYPVYYVSSYHALKYCNLRSMKEGLTPCYLINGSTDPGDWGTIPIFGGSISQTWDYAICNWGANGYRLPTEAEWEYAGRGGVYWQNNYKFSGSNTLDEVAWTISNSETMSHPVGTKKPNQLGLYDMTGNIYEWTWDYLNYDYYSTCNELGTVNDPHGPQPNTVRILRGGSWSFMTDSYNVAHRLIYSYPSTQGFHFGIRVVRSKL
jgi:formylglycine-generating enzyme required for sulfatase activity